MRQFKKNIFRLSEEIVPTICINYSVEIPEVNTVIISYYDCNNNPVSLEPLTGPDVIQFCAKEGTVLRVPSDTSVLTTLGSCKTMTTINTGTFGADTYLDAICKLNICYPNIVAPFNSTRYASEFPIVLGTTIYDSLSPLTHSVPLSSTSSYYAYTIGASTEKWFKINSVGVVIEAGEYL